MVVAARQKKDSLKRPTAVAVIIVIARRDGNKRSGKGTVDKRSDKGTGKRSDKGTVDKRSDKEPIRF